VSIKELKMKNNMLPIALFELFSSGFEVNNENDSVFCKSIKLSFFTMSSTKPVILVGSTNIKMEFYIKISSSIYNLKVLSYLPILSFKFFSPGSEVNNKMDSVLFKLFWSHN